MGNRVMLVTGGLSGIGAAVVERMAGVGRVYVADCATPGDAQTHAAHLTRVQLDVTDTEQWKDLAARIAAEEGGIDGVVHAAGIAPISPLEQTSDELIDRTYATNVRAVIVGSRELAPLLRVRRGSVVTVASVSGLVGQDASAAYVASKGAVISLTRALAVEFAPFHVRVNCVSPGTTDTPMLARHFDSLPDGEAARAHMISRQPIGRLLTPADIAPTILHLLNSEATGGVTGANYIIDGGLTATFDYGNSFAGGGDRASENRHR